MTAKPSTFDPPSRKAALSVDPFKLSETTAYGRMRIDQQIESHDHIISKVRRDLFHFNGFDGFH